MTLLTRISRLVKSDLHGILDVIEDPQAVLKQALRDMEEALDAEKSALEEAKSMEQKIATTIQVLELSRQQADEKITLCFESGQESLARTFVRRKLETERRVVEHDRDIQALRLEQAAIEKRIGLQEEELRRVQEKAALVNEIAAAQQIASNRSPGSAPAGISDEDVELAFIAEKRRRGQAEASH